MPLTPERHFYFLNVKESSTLIMEYVHTYINVSVENICIFD